MACFWHKLINSTCVPEVIEVSTFTLANITMDDGVYLNIGGGAKPWGMEWDVANESFYLVDFDVNEIVRYSGMTNGDISTVGSRTTVWDEGYYTLRDVTKSGSTYYSPADSFDVMADSVGSFPGYDLPENPWSVTGGGDYVCTRFNILYHMSGSTVLDSIALSSLGISGYFDGMDMLADGRTIIGVTNGSNTTPNYVSQILLGPSGSVSDAQLISQGEIVAWDWPNHWTEGIGVLVNEEAGKLYISDWDYRYIFQYSLNL